MSPKFWTQIRGITEILEVPRLGTTHPEIESRTGLPTPDVCGDSSLTEYQDPGLGRMGWGFARTSD